jgi:hypothetical protein
MADIELRWTTTALNVATDHAVSANDPDEWPIGYPTFARVLYFSAAAAAAAGVPAGWYEHIGENGTQVVLGQTLPIWVYKRMP